jgi:hypothetical protein
MINIFKNKTTATIQESNGPRMTIVRIKGYDGVFFRTYIVDTNFKENQNLVFLEEDNVLFLTESVGNLEDDMVFVVKKDKNGSLFINLSLEHINIILTIYLKTKPFNVDKTNSLSIGLSQSFVNNYQECWQLNGEKIRISSNGNR